MMGGEAARGRRARGRNTMENRFHSKNACNSIMIRKCLIAALVAVVFGIITRALFTDGSTGLLQMPTAEMRIG